MDVVINWVYNRQINCLPTVERSVFDVLLPFFGVPPVQPVPKAVYVALWPLSAPFGGRRELIFRSAFRLEIVTIEGVDFVVSAIPAWWLAYWVWRLTNPTEAAAQCTYFPFD